MDWKKILALVWPFIVRIVDAILKGDQKAVAELTGQLSEKAEGAALKMSAKIATKNKQ